MKRIASMTVTAALVMVSASPALAGDRFTITGTVPGISDSTRIVLSNIERGNPETIIETVTTDGSFTLTDTVKMPTLCRLSVQQRYKRGGFSSRASFKLMVENTDMNVSFLESVDSIGNSYEPEGLVKVEGGEAQRQYDDYIAACGPADLKARKAGYLHAEKYFATNDNPDSMAVYEAIEKQAAAEFKAARMKFVAEHPSWHISSVLVLQELMDIFKYSDSELIAMAESVRECPDTARVNLIDRTLAWSRQYSLGRDYDDFEADNTEGAPVKLSQYVEPGKYTFIDFWASWCGPCRAAIPHVRKLREQYVGRMNVLSISCDESEPDWRKAMEKEAMEWEQLRLNPTQLREAGRLYCISAIPRLILLDPTGRIVCSTNFPKEIDAYLEAATSSTSLMPPATL